MMQPYAWLFAHGYLVIDDRTWSTAHRGPLAIHASKRFHTAYWAFLRDHTSWPLPEPKEFEQGGLVARVQMKECRGPTQPLGAPLQCIDLRRSHFGAGGHYGWVFSNAQAVPFTPLKGRLGLFEVADGLLESSALA